MAVVWGPLAGYFAAKAPESLHLTPVSPALDGLQSPIVFDISITGYHHAVAVTWQTSIDQLNETAQHLSARLALLAPDPVPAFLLDMAVPNGESEDQHGALADLATVSLVTRETDGERFSVHHLV